MIRLIKFLIWRPIWHIVYFLLLKPRRFIYVIGGLIAIIAFTGSYKGKSGSVLLQTGQSAEHLPYAERYMPAQQLPEMKGPIANGNGVFNKSLAQNMPVNDMQTYSGYFYHAMHWVSGGQAYPWMESPYMFGTITPSDAFLAKSGVYCRRFQETLSYAGKNERLRGIACQRRKGGWCKLRPNSAHNCEIGKPNSIMMWLKSLF